MSDDTHRIWYLKDDSGYTDCVLLDAEKFCDHMVEQKIPVAIMQLKKLKEKDESRVERWIELSRKTLKATESYIKGEDTYSLEDIKNLTTEIELYAMEIENGALDKRNQG